MKVHSLRIVWLAVGLTSLSVPHLVRADNRAPFCKPQESGTSCAVKIINSNNAALLPVAVHLLKGEPKRSPDTAFNLGLLHMVGKGVKKDESQAAALFEEAANLGHSQAALNLAQLNMAGVPRYDVTAALRWFRVAADGGNLVAAHNLGLILLEGTLAPRDIASGIKYSEFAARAGHEGAAFNLGQLYLYGKGVRTDYSLAREWFEKAARKGHPASQAKLALMYARGLGVQQDQAMFKQWLLKAARGGDENAMAAAKSMNLPIN
ncbi:tetratricopeptide repeat protein [Massilia sp. YMA4]|uniref:tetratricopeptide repeat protein n=1 Tax=Massilia sp. YMA4 TaxID=1593482 RepID=UPI000DD1217C|nr:tetratricopeptide repeat protein [Massilia sp. YMA4]AXA90368.1 hypothetical protein DPH57_03800 [Massilia sp. YMA4]